MNGSTLLQFAFTAFFECLQLLVLYPCDLPGMSVQGLRSQLKAQESLSSLRALWHYHSQKQCVFFPPLAVMTCCCLEKTSTIYLQHHLLLSPGHGWTLGEEGAWIWGWTLEEAQRSSPQHGGLNRIDTAGPPWMSPSSLTADGEGGLLLPHKTFGPPGKPPVQLENVEPHQSCNQHGNSLRRDGKGRGHPGGTCLEGGLPQRADLGPILFTISINAAVPPFRQLMLQRPEEPSIHPPS